MACGPSLLTQLKDIVGQIDDRCPPCCAAGGCAPCCAAGYEGPFAAVTMVCPPPILAPTAPQPVKPLQLPCPAPTNNEMSEETAVKLRYANFYNNYNIDWHLDTTPTPDGCPPPCPPSKAKAVTIDGKNPCCEDYTKINKRDEPLPGCPTGFKPCTMKLTPPPGCHPMGVWTAQIQPCPPKFKRKVSLKYEPGPCTRPCCKHWQPKEGPCKYDEPCIAHCFNHPPGIKPRKKT